LARWGALCVGGSGGAAPAGDGAIAAPNNASGTATRRTSPCIWTSSGASDSTLETRPARRVAGRPDHGPRLHPLPPAGPGLVPGPGPLRDRTAGPAAGSAAAAVDV